LPYLHGLHLDAEDAVQAAQQDRGEFRIVVPALPRISNHTDFDILRAHPQVDLRFVGPGSAIPSADLFVLPGSKNTCADLAWLREQGWEPALLKHLRYGGRVIGICGGFQMLGRIVADPHGIEGEPGSTAGFGLLDLETELTPAKRLANVAGRCRFATAAVQGYEIHMGMSRGAALKNPAFDIEGRAEGAISADNQILGTYLHGVFDHPQACAALLQWAGLERAEGIDQATLREASLERLADTCQPLLRALQLLTP